MRAVEESVRKDLNAASQSSTTSEPLLQSGPPRERTKLVISIQDKDGLKQFRVFVVCSPLYYCEAKNAQLLLLNELYQMVLMYKMESESNVIFRP